MSAREWSGRRSSSDLSHSKMKALRTDVEQASGSPTHSIQFMKTVDLLDSLVSSRNNIYFLLRVGETNKRTIQEVVR